MVTMPDSFDLKWENIDWDPFLRKATKILSKLKEGADKSGNAQIWHRGEPLDGLTQGLRERILKGLKFGI